MSGDGASSTSHTVARGTARLLTGLFAGKALDFALYLVLARGLGVEQFGRHMFGLSFTLLFSVIADLGVCTVFAREAARAPHAVPALLRTALLAKLALASATLIVAPGIAALTGAPLATLGLIGVFTMGMLINSAAVMFECLLKASGRAGVAGLSIVAQGMTALAAGVLMLGLGAGVMTGALAYLAGSIMHLATALAWSWPLWHPGAAAPRAVLPETEGSRDDAVAAALVVEASDDVALAATVATATGAPRSHAAAPFSEWVTSPFALMRESAPLALSGVFIAIYFRMDSVLLNVLEGPAAVGLYGSVYRFFEALVLVSAAYRSVLFPIMARSADGPPEALGVLCRKSFRVQLIFTVGVAVLVTVESRRIVEVLLGPAYADAAPALAILMWALPAAFMLDTLLHLLAAQRRQIHTARAVAITAAFNVALNLILIPRWSILGAAAATVASELVCFALMFATFRRTVPGTGLARAIRAPLAAGIAAALAMAALAPVSPGGASGMVISGCVGVFVYVVTLVLMGAVGRADADLVRAMLPPALTRRSARSGPTRSP